MKHVYNVDQYASESFGLGETPVELDKNVDEGAKQAGMTEGSLLEANLWLPAAAPVYKISPKLSDYVLVPIPAMLTDIPNTNGDSIDIHEFLKFDPKLGMQAFKTFRGKPCFYEHDNKNIKKAKGVILDVFMRPLKNFGNGKHWKLVLLLAYDRSKDPLLVNSILTKENNAYSIGFYFQSYTCSICGHVCGTGGASQFCSHTMPRKPTYDLDGRLVYRKCHSIVGFETSVVNSPAFVSAIGPHFLNLAEF